MKVPAPPPVSRAAPSEQPHRVVRTALGHVLWFAVETKGVAGMLLLYRGWFLGLAFSTVLLAAANYMFECHRFCSLETPSTCPAVGVPDSMEAARCTPSSVTGHATHTAVLLWAMDGSGGSAASEQSRGNSSANVTAWSPLSPLRYDDKAALAQVTWGHGIAWVSPSPSPPPATNRSNNNNNQTTTTPSAIQLIVDGDAAVPLTTIGHSPPPFDVLASSTSFSSQLPSQPYFISTMTDIEGGADSTTRLTARQVLSRLLPRSFFSSFRRDARIIIAVAIDAFYNISQNETMTMAPSSSETTSTLLPPSNTTAVANVSSEGATVAQDTMTTTATTAAVVTTPRPPPAIRPHLLVDFAVGGDDAVPANRSLLLASAIAGAARNWSLRCFDAAGRDTCLIPSPPVNSKSSVDSGNWKLASVSLQRRGAFVHLLVSNQLDIGHNTTSIAFGPVNAILDAVAQQYFTELLSKNLLSLTNASSGNPNRSLGVSVTIAATLMYEAPDYVLVEMVWRYGCTLLLIASLGKFYMSHVGRADSLGGVGGGSVIRVIGRLAKSFHRFDFKSFQRDFFFAIALTIVAIIFCDPLCGLGLAVKWNRAYGIWVNCTWLLLLSFGYAISTTVAAVLSSFDESWSVSFTLVVTFFALAPGAALIAGHVITYLEGTTIGQVSTTGVDSRGRDVSASAIIAVACVWITFAAWFIGLFALYWWNRHSIVYNRGTPRYRGKLRIQVLQLNALSPIMLYVVLFVSIVYLPLVIVSSFIPVEDNGDIAETGIATGFAYTVLSLASVERYRVSQAPPSPHEYGELLLYHALPGSSSSVGGGRTRRHQPGYLEPPSLQTRGGHRRRTRQYTANEPIGEANTSSSSPSGSDNDDYELVVTTTPPPPLTASGTYDGNGLFTQPSFTSLSREVEVPALVLQEPTLVMSAVEHQSPRGAAVLLQQRKLPQWQTIPWTESHFDFARRHGSGYIFDTEYEFISFYEAHPAALHRCFPCWETLNRCLAMSNEAYFDAPQDTRVALVPMQERWCLRDCLVRLMDMAPAKDSEKTDDVDDLPADASPPQVRPLNVSRYGYQLSGSMLVHEIQIVVCYAVGARVREMGQLEHVLVSFRGTANATNAAIDADFCGTVFNETVDMTVGNVTVHRGFAFVFDAIRGHLFDGLEQALEKASLSDTTIRKDKIPIILTGHSLGGAVACLAAVGIEAEFCNPLHVYTFGAPRVGNLAFRQKYDRVVPNTFRVVCENDGVVHIQACFRPHFGRLIALDRDGNYVVDPQDVERKFNPLYGAGAKFRNHLLHRYARCVEKVFTTRGIPLRSYLSFENDHEETRPKRPPSRNSANDDVTRAEPTTTAVLHVSVGDSDAGSDVTSPATTTANYTRRLGGGALKRSSSSSAVVVGGAVPSWNVDAAPPLSSSPPNEPGMEPHHHHGTLGPAPGAVSYPVRPPSLFAENLAATGSSFAMGTSFVPSGNLSVRRRKHRGRTQSNSSVSSVDDGVDNDAAASVVSSNASSREFHSSPTGSSPRKNAARKQHDTVVSSERKGQEGGPIPVVAVVTPRVNAGGSRGHSRQVSFADPVDATAGRGGVVPKTPLTPSAPTTTTTTTVGSGQVVAAA